MRISLRARSSRIRELSNGELSFWVPGSGFCVRVPVRVRFCARGVRIERGPEPRTLNTRAGRTQNAEPGTGTPGSHARILTSGAVHRTDIALPVPAAAARAV